MQTQAGLLSQISDSFYAGAGFAEFMYFASEDTEFVVMSQELNAARKWINRTNQQSEPRYWEKIPDIVELLRACAEMTRRNGYEFMAADFETLADESTRMRTESAALEGC